MNPLPPSTPSLRPYRCLFSWKGDVFVQAGPCHLVSIEAALWHLPAIVIVVIRPVLCRDHHHHHRDSVVLWKPQGSPNPPPSGIVKMTLTVVNAALTVANVVITVVTMALTVVKMPLILP